MSITRSYDFTSFRLKTMEKTSTNRSDLYHFLFLTMSMCWLMLFVFYAPNLGLLMETNGVFASQNLFVSFYCILILVGLFIPKLFTLHYYRKLTLIGVLGTILCSIMLISAAGFFRLVLIAFLGLFCGLFSYAGIVFILIKVLSFNWQIASVSYIVGINPLFSILINNQIIQFGTLGYWLFCFGILLVMLGLCWFGFIKNSDKENPVIKKGALKNPHRISRQHTRRMVWLAYGMVFIITLITLYAFFISEKTTLNSSNFIYFYAGQILAGVLSFLLLFYKRNKLPLLFYGFLVVAFLGFTLMLLKDITTVLLSPAIILLGCAELGSILSWCLIPRVCRLWEAAHAFDSENETTGWSLRALRGFMLSYALAILFGTFSATYLYQLSSSAFFILSITSLIILFIGNVFLVGFTQYQFFPTTGKVQIEGPVAQDAVKRLNSLTERETQILGFMLQGYSMPQIAEKLTISLNTVKTHGSNIYRKLDVNSRRELLLRYLDKGNQQTIASDWKFLSSE